MEKKKETSKIIEGLEECSERFLDVNNQIRALYDTIKGVKNPKEREQLMYMYKQTYDALSKYTTSFNGLIMVVKDEVENGRENDKRE